MFQENLKALRREKGMSQEELAARLHVVRQTISKWEKGLSVPDSALLIRLAEVFEVPVSELLGERIEAEEQPNALAEQLARINEHLAIRNRRGKRIWKALAWIAGGIVAAILLVTLLLAVLSSSPLPSDVTVSGQILDPIGGEK